MNSRRTLAASLAGGALLLGSVLAASGSAAPKGIAFNAPVKVTPTNGGGYEPGLIADRYGNLYSTAHKENAELVVSPDPRNPAMTRSQSWAWYSDDFGKSWKNLPEGPADIYSHTFGDEGDLAMDDAGGVYMVDTNVTDINFTAWKATGRGKIAFRSHLPITAFGEPLDDRPWVTAHLDGHVFYFGNQGDKLTYPVANQGETYGSGTGPGRYTVYKSADAGATWDHVGIQLKDSGWCRPAAAPNSSYVYAFCTDDAGADDEITNQGEAGHTVGKLYAYVSANDGKTWERYDTGARYNGHISGGYYSWPSFTVAKDGSLWGLYTDGITPGCKATSCTPTSSRFLLTHSTDHGKHWKVMDATPTLKGVYMYSWLAVSPDGKTLGLATYAHAKAGAPWYVYGATFKPGQHPVLTSIQPKTPVSTAASAPGDFLSSAFDAQGKLNVVWTQVVTTANAVAASAYVYRDIYSARSK